jgi:hypothetical protein
LVCFIALPAMDAARPSSPPTRRSLPLLRARASSKSVTGECGRRKWPDLELVQNWQAFLENPDLYLRHVVD